MALFRRNINGWDLSALRQHIGEEQPVPRETIIERFYPGGPEDPDESDQRKNLNDAIDFLVETDQFLLGDNGYKLSDEFDSATSARVALLRGLRTQEGENATYNDVLEALTEDDKRYFNHRDQLEDMMSGRRSDASWNETRLGYWVRTMETIGLVERVNASTDEDHSAVLSMEQKLLGELLQTVMSTDSRNQLRDALDELHEYYVPVYSRAGHDTVAAYMQDCLTLADHQGAISLGHDSDFGQAVEINESEYNSISLSEEEEGERE
jgi:hypothetical protein